MFEVYVANKDFKEPFLCAVCEYEIDAQEKAIQLERHYDEAWITAVSLD